MMKSGIKLLVIFLAILSLVKSNTVNAQGVDKKTETFMVYGNCEMCQERIEGALKKKEGVIKKEWNPESKLLTVTFDPNLISIIQIKQKLASVGYDTDEVQASNEDYNKLPKCCHYKRAKS